MNLFVWNACPTKAAPNTNKQPPCELLTVFCLVLKNETRRRKVTLSFGGVDIFLARQTFIQNSFIFLLCLFYFRVPIFRALKLKNKNKIVSFFRKSGNRQRELSFCQQKNKRSTGNHKGIIEMVALRVILIYFL